MPPPPVAVAVVSWNTRDLLARCLRALEPDAAAGRADVHVVDNGSTDGSRDLVRREFPWARLLTPSANLGFGRAVNLVAARTRAPWLVAANADTAPEPGALERLLAAAAADPGAGAVAPRLILPDGSTQHSVHPFPTLRFTLAFNLGLVQRDRAHAEALCLEGAWDPDRPRRVPWAVGAFLLLRRAAWDAVGGFDPAQWMYAEDLDLGWRLRRAGWATRYEPGARVRHAAGAATSQAWADAATARWMAETHEWLRRRHGHVPARAIAGVNAAGAGARALFWAARARREPAAHGWRRDQARAWARLHAAGLAPRRRRDLRRRPGVGSEAVAREGVVEAAGARLWYRVDGAGPDVALVHAGAADARMWDAVVERLADRARCIRFDGRGFGRTAYEAGRYSPSDDLEAVLAALDVRQAVVVGASFGGLVALEHAVAHPARVRRLVLLDPLLPDQEWSEDFLRFADAEEAALAAGRLEEAVELNLRMWAPRAPLAAQALLREMQRRAFELQAAAPPEPVALEPPVTERLAQLEIPALVAYGEEDVPDFVAIARRLARALPRATLQAIPGVGHLPALERPEAVAEAIAAALADG